MSRPIFIAYVAAATAAFVVASATLLAPPVAAQENAINRIDQYWMAYYDRQRSDAEVAIDVQVADDEPLILADNEDSIDNSDVGVSIFQRRTTYVHVHKFCEAEFNPPEGWLRPNGFCGLTDQRAKGSLLYTGEDYNFGFKSR